MKSDPNVTIYLIQWWSTCRLRFQRYSKRMPVWWVPCVNSLQSQSDNLRGIATGIIICFTTFMY